MAGVDTKVIGRESPIDQWADYRVDYRVDYWADRQGGLTQKAILPIH